MFVIFFSVILGSFLQAQERSLFNGKDLSGWDGNPELWSVQNGAITGITKETSRFRTISF